MLDIRKDNKVVSVTEESFRNFFKNMGWEIVSAPKAKKSKKDEAVENVVENVKEEQATDSEDQEWDEEEWNDEEVEKPISEMNREELIAYADKKGIDISGLNSTKQIREAVKNS